jgi:alpha-glucosidase
MAKQQPPKATHPVHISETTTGERYPDVYDILSPDTFDQMHQKGNTLLINAKNGVALRIQALSEDILRFRYAPEGRFEADFSYALDPHAAYESPEITVSEDEAHLTLRTSSLICQIAKEGLKVAIYDNPGNTLLCEDAAPYACRKSILNGIEQVSITQKAPAETAYYGLGDKSGALNLRGQRLQHWNTDSFGYGKDTDPLYRTIPFFFGLQEGKGYGIFLHNSYRTHFDFAKTAQDQVTFQADGGEMDYFFIAGPGLTEVAQRYAWLTGRPEMPPMWALGFHQCRWSYYPEERVYEIAKEFRDRQIPCDAIYIDIDYMDGYRCFTWDEEHFPRPAKMIKDLRDQGFHTIVMIDPGIRVDPEYHVYKEGMEKDMFCYRTSGELMRGPVWPQDCVFPDFTRPEVREWWGPLYEQFYNEQGISGFWNDMNEPAVFKVNIATFPDNVRHDYDGNPCDHRKAHNVYGQQMSRATFNGLKALQPQKRPFVLTRATYSGGQRYASVWTGDNIASWEHLRLANIQCQRLSISGFSFVGTDVGGFSQQPDGELFARWMQLATFHPLYRVHSMGNNVDGAAEADADAIHEAERTNRMDQEPWTFGEPYTSISKAAIELRYQLLPYLYTAFRQYTQDGRPVLRSLAFADQSNPEVKDREAEFLFGEHLLVVPVLEAGATQSEGYLPAGEWYDYYSGVRYQGRQLVKNACGLERIPLYVKAGAVIPHYPVQQYTGEKNFDQITLKAFAGNGQSELYEDAGDGYAYQEEAFRLSSFNMQQEKGQLTLRQVQTGTYEPGYLTYRVELFGLSGKPAKATCDGEELKIEALEQGGFTCTLPAGFHELVVR